jgi:hypothetical protein
MSDINGNEGENREVILAKEQREKDLIESNRLLAQQLEELRNEKSFQNKDNNSQRTTGNRLSFISDFIGAILSSLGSSHSALSVNFGGGVRGAVFAAVYQSIFLIGLTAISYGFYQVTNMQEQKVFIPNEEFHR